ncbi:N-acetyl-D-Glu racemase DgcA [Streptomyces sp. NPDC086082]|uniref:N-acetyl-D-Glu racemase DgcA n=1 Tax=Streptomyces sp. NPDC086082 TaxID=3365750 RepID=UPI003810669C
MRTLSVLVENFPIQGVFRISRGEKTVAQVVTVTISQDGVTGRGEGVPYARYGESVASVCAQIEQTRGLVEAGMSVEELQSALPAGAARNALDCALWDLTARSTGQDIAALSGLQAPLRPVVTAYTLSLDTPERMGAVACRHAELPVLKVKLGGAGDLERVEAVRAAAPSARLIADANESWTPEQLCELAPPLRDLGVELIEQPLPAAADDFLASYKSPVPLAADESCRDLTTLKDVVGKYAFATIKLDKTGGLTEALQLESAARIEGLKTMTGCMVATSLSMAPGIVLAQRTDVVHLDGPLLLARDREPSLRYVGAVAHPADGGVWAQ